MCRFTEDFEVALQERQEWGGYHVITGRKVGGKLNIFSSSSLWKGTTATRVQETLE